MIELHPTGVDRILCLGAHCDDIEIGCGGTILTILEQVPSAEVYWVVFASDEQRKREALKSAEIFLSQARSRHIAVEEFRESFFPYCGTAIKEYFERLKREFSPDLILTHQRGDLHQDHRLISELTWSSFRDHLILEYEIPKWDGDLGAPNVFVPLSQEICQRKFEALYTCFESQHGRDWFTEDTFYSLLRLRGMECRSPSRYAEAFYAPKLKLGVLRPTN